MKIKVTLASILFLALLLRVVNLTQVPSILNRDEAALAYNAYLLSETGLDEWRREADVALESFGDYKLIGYPAVLTGLFKFMPVNDLTVKAPSVLAGTLLVFLFYLFARNFKISKRYALLGSFLIATNPVFIFYSRMAFEANLALSLFVFGMVLLTRKTKKSSRIFIDSLALISIFFATITYNTPLLLLPFLIAFLILFRGIKNYQRWIFPVVGLSTIFGAVFLRLAPLVERKSDITIFSDASVWTEYVNYAIKYPPGIIRNLLGNKYIYFGQLILKNIFSSFSPWFVVQNGGANPWHSIINWGHLNFSTYIFALVGLSVSFSRLFDRKILSKIQENKILLLAVFAVSTLAPAVVTVDAPHATRSLVFFFLLIFFSVFGLEKFANTLRSNFKNKKVLSHKNIIIFFVVISSIITTKYMYDYFTIFKIDHRKSWLAGFDQVIQEADKTYPKDKQIAIVDGSGYHYILLSWYLRVEPESFFSTVIRQNPDRIGFRYGQQVENYHFIAQNKDRNDQEKVLIEWNGNYWQIFNY